MQEFARRTLGSWGDLVFSLVVSASAMGALNANVFATAKLVVTASQRRYFPAILSNLHATSVKDEAESLDRSLAAWPPVLKYPLTRFVHSTRQLRWQLSVPM
jgi:solute carrier family 7 (L-type amino acid transporter), member 6